MHHIQRSLAVLGMLLALAACGGTAARAATPRPSPSAAGEEVQVTLTDFQIAPAQVTVHGSAVVFRVANQGRTPHDLTLRTASGTVVGHTAELDPGRSATLALHLDAGTYTSFCSLPGHESLGMRGTVTVDG